jgi:TatD DNase family protein
VDCGIRLAEKYDFIYATLGIHPHEARLADEAAYQNMERLAQNPKVIAWGEIGLDYFYDYSPRDVQKTVFIRQMELAAAAKLPIVIHCRPSEASENAWDDCLALIKDHWAANALGGILHCFTGNWEQAKSALDMGFMISFAGNLTFPKAQQIRDAALQVPMDRLLIETDSPYLAPVPNRGKRNEPAFVKHTAQKLAELRGRTTEEIGQQTSSNFYKFFKLAETTEKKVSAG